MQFLKHKRPIMILVAVVILGILAFIGWKLRQLYVPVVSPTIADVPYTVPDDGVRRIDIFLPANKTGPFPGIVMLHGDAGDKTSLSSVAAHYQQSGFVVFLPTYRINPVQMNDGYCALGWIVAHANQYQINLHRLFLLGWSSGGGIAAELATVHDATPFMKDCSNLVPKTPWIDGVVLYAAGSDRWMGTGWKTDQPPLTWLSGGEPPFFILHGSADSLVPPADSQQLAAALQSAGDKVDLTIIPNADHRSIIKGFTGNEAVWAAMDKAFAELSSYGK